MIKSATLGIFIATLCLVCIGTAMVYSSSAAMSAYQKRVILSRKAPDVLKETNLYHDASFLKKQVLWVFISIAVLVFFYHYDYVSLGRKSYWILGSTIFLLLMVLVVGNRINGAKRWLRLGPFTVQPSEFAKLALVIFMARFLSEHKDKVKSFARGFLPVLSILSATLVLIILEPDFGTTVIIGMIVFTIWFIAGLRLLHLSSLFLASLPCAIVVILLNPYRVRRILGFLDPWKHARGSAYQVIQSQIAVGSGGLTGRGLGEGLQKYHFLAESHTDFIFAIVGEELGFIGATLVLLLFVAILWMGVIVALRASDYYTGLLASGVVTMITLSAVVNFCVVLGLLPPKGLALPFISYGGSSLLANMAGIGILLNISKVTEESLGTRLRRKF
ncbi:putative lipid II flippase FtsW [Candidatus Sumerlaeota bacterium]|nr:putative lipid II flippase FtsW [Candidatus Sumerlaeota bacterium]